MISIDKAKEILNRYIECKKAVIFKKRKLAYLRSIKFKTSAGCSGGGAKSKEAYDRMTVIDDIESCECELKHLTESLSDVKASVENYINVLVNEEHRNILTMFYIREYSCLRIGFEIGKSRSETYRRYNTALQEFSEIFEPIHPLS